MIEKRLVIGVNLFKPNERQELCIQSLVKLSNMFKVDLVNLQFENSVDLYEDSRIPTLKCLKKMSKDFIGSKTKPIIKEFFDALCVLDYDYFCFVNNDIIVSDRYIKLLNDSNYDCYPTCRLAIQPIKNLSDPIIGSHYQCVGFDAFAVRSEWWIHNSYRFLNFIAGHPEWDVDYATVMRVHGNTFFVNEWPACIFHIIHEAPWTTSEKDSEENNWNKRLHYIDHVLYSKMWWKYVYEVPLTRGGNYWYPHKNEKEIEDRYFPRLP